MMEKKKSNKKLNKITKSYSKYQHQSKIPMESIQREIGELKKQLVSIKSRKHLDLAELQQNNKKNINSGSNQPVHELQNTLKARNISHSKQNALAAQCKCSHSHQNRTKDIPPLKIQLFSITAPRSRETKLKLSIQLNKLKSQLQKLNRESRQTQSLQLMIAQLNSTFIYANSIMKEYENEIEMKKTQYKDMKSQLSELSSKIIELAQRHSNRKHTGINQMEQIAELKRYLSYYINLMKENKDQAEKYVKQYADLENYVKQLENSNELLRKQGRQFKQRQQQTELKLKQNQLHVQNVARQLSLLESDLNLSNIESEKNRQKRKELEKLNQKLNEQLKDMTHKFNSKQTKLIRSMEQKLQLQRSISELRQQLRKITIMVTTQRIEEDKLHKQNTIFSLKLRQKQQEVLEKQQQLKNLKYQLQLQIKNGKKSNDSLEYCQMEINSLSQEIDELRKANERYKNQHFRNKLIQPHKEGQTDKNVKGNAKRNEENLRGDNWDNFKSKNRKKVLCQIQELIQKHRKSSDSQSQESQDVN